MCAMKIDPAMTAVLNKLIEEGRTAAEVHYKRRAGDAKPEPVDKPEKLDKRCSSVRSLVELGQLDLFSERSGD